MGGASGSPESCQREGSTQVGSSTELGASGAVPCTSPRHLDQDWKSIQRFCDLGAKQSCLCVVAIAAAVISETGASSGSEKWTQLPQPLGKIRRQGHLLPKQIFLNQPHSGIGVGLPDAFCPTDPWKEVELSPFPKRKRRLRHTGVRGLPKSHSMVAAELGLQPGH